MNNKIKISGVAAREGLSRNDRKYLSEELNKFAPTLIGRPILKDHNGTTDNTIGKITNATSIDNGKIITYEGWVKEDGTGIIEKIKDGRISEVSIGAFSRKVVKEKEEDTFVIPVDMEALELSTTPVPGIAGTSLQSEEQTTSEKTNLSEIEIRNMIESYESQSQSLDDITIENKKEDKMDSENKLEINEKTQESVVVDNNKELSELKTQLETLKKQNENLEILRRQDAIKKYEEKCKGKKTKIQDLTNATMEAIELATSIVDSIEIAEVKVEEKVEVKVEEKIEAKPQTKEVEVEIKKNESFNKYVLDMTDSLGYAFYKYY